MKNHNISYFKGNVETSISNGDFRQILIFPGVSSSFIKFLDSFQDRKEIEPSDEFPYYQTLLKIKSPFRIGLQQVRLIHVNDFISKNELDVNGLKNFLLKFCSKFKNSINALPLTGVLSCYTSEVEKILDEIVRDTKIVIIS
jgi:hypothetical protein